MIRFFVIAIIFFILLSCTNDIHPFQNYPEIIKKYKLEEHYDIAKWEVYKVNMLYSATHGTTYLVNFESDSIKQHFFTQERDFNNRGKELFREKAEVQKIVRERNLLPFINVELALFSEDSSDLFRGDEIILIFFPKRTEEKWWQSPSGKLCYSIIFQKEKIVGYGCGNIEWYYSIEDQKNDDKKFRKLLEDQSYTNPWLDWYVKNEIKPRH